MKLRDNQWGFDIALDNPFRIFRVLRHEAIQNVGESNVVDLSRGDPGYGFSPSVAGREFYSYLVQLDCFLNAPGNNFVVDNRDDFQTLWEHIQEHTRAIYQEKKADEFLEKLYFFLTRIEKYAANEDDHIADKGVTEKEVGCKGYGVNEDVSKGVDSKGRCVKGNTDKSVSVKNWDKRKILFEMFKYATVSGGSYHDPQGELLARLVVADHHNATLDLGIRSSDLIFTQGVSHGIGTLFKLFFDEAIGFLKKGDAVLITSPAYAPYNTILERRGLVIFPIPVDSATGQVDGDIEEILSRAPKNVKLICMIDPNNPTGFMFNETFLARIGQFAEEKDALIISDEVYSDFFFARKKSMMHFARKRTIVMTGRSKIERSTGLRFGEYIVPDEADEYIGKHIFQGKLDGNANLKALLIAAKGPGGIHGEFQHTTFVTGPSQYLAISHVIFGNEDRKEYLRRIRVNMESFYEILGLPYRKNFYYANFNLLDIPGTTKRGLTPEDIFLGLAHKGVVLIPSNLFYSPEERKHKDYRSFARASLANLSFTQLQKAAKLIKDFMRG